jgi:hypothetical protein
MAQFDILCRINGVDMKWYDNIGLGHIAFRSWLLAQILLCFRNLATCAGKTSLRRVYAEVMGGKLGVNSKWVDLARFGGENA